ncbi:MAG: ATP-dependent DNA helicase RecG, partial [Proteobacteria bacterium]|nr:ATP-dependent DNA helicase RecG [Pseudomonadota bacterium]
MRPQALFPLFAEVTALPGLGPRLGKLMAKVAGPRVADLLWHLPTGFIDRRFTPKVAEAPAGCIATLIIQIQAHLPPTAPRRPYRVRCIDETGTLHLVFFHAREDYLRKMLPEGEQRAVSGRVEHFGGEIQMAHPDHIVPVSELASLQTIEPVYPLTDGLTPKSAAKAIRAALERAPDLDEWLDPAFRERQSWQGWRATLRRAHAPCDLSALEPGDPDRRRLAYDELLANQLALSLMRAHQMRQTGRSLRGDGARRESVASALPYRLTGSQRQAIEEIAADMAKPGRMLRLLQGDVGSGKTVVALFTMLIAIEAGAQAALMAPTEVLARQHHAVISPLAAAAGVRVGLLTGRDRGKARDAVIEQFSSGETAIAIGTHALFQEGVAFNDLGLAVIDEQHRFGVHQRINLGAKGQGVDMLVMTATPIPRTLMLTAYGDMETSRLTEKPAGRRPIDTRTIPISRLDDVIAAVSRAIEGGARVYWVCPMVEESEAIDLAAAVERHAELAARFGSGVGLIHGRMKGPEKDAAMAAFADGTVALLVATTVIEVGVDIPEATVMVVEHAERYGLAQLHQLRGRIGRSTAPSTCLLLYTRPLGETARARLDILRQTD